MSMTKLLETLALSTAMLACSTSAIAQQPSAPAPPPCKTAEFRTLDFWVGEWIAEDQAGNGIATNRVTRNEYGDCVITEHFTMNDGSMVGHSVSIYLPALKQWRQNWVDSQGSYFDLVGGPVTGGDHIFMLENKRVADAQPYRRMIWQDVKPDSFTWRWQGKAKAEDAWADSWIIRYRRKK